MKSASCKNREDRNEGKSRGTLYFIVIGVVSMLWFLLRVIPKPSRITYPCQRVAAANTVAFLTWLFGTAAVAAISKKAFGKFRQNRVGLALGLLLAALIVGTVTLLQSSLHDVRAAEKRVVTAGFVPPEGANQPMGVAQGIYPGRVTWAYDSMVVSYDPGVPNGKYWEDQNTNPEKVDKMWSESLDAISGATTTYSSWEKLFQYTNTRKGVGDVGYAPGEKIAIKINWSAGLGHPAFDITEPVVVPQLLMAIISDLIGVVGVTGSDITVYDVSAYIHDDIMDPFKDHENPEYQNVRFVGNPKWLQSEPGRYIAAEADLDAPIHFADESVVDVYWVKSLTGSDYLINIANFKAHDLAGVTFCAKNLYGSVFIPTYSYESAGDTYIWGFGPYNETDKDGNRDPHQGLHKCIAVDDYAGLGGFEKRPYGSYNYLVDILGHPQIHNKTMMYVVDGFYGGMDQKNISKFESFGGKYSASLFMSQDVIALESVCLDFLSEELVVSEHVTGNVDNYLHESAKADDPPSGIEYNPGNTADGLASLGVHEHWNSWEEKQYSRNLGTGEGIELFQVKLNTGIGKKEWPGTRALLKPPYPNPFTGSTTIPYHLDREQRIIIEIYNVAGRQVEILVEGTVPAGTHMLHWDASGLTEGIYYCRMWTEEGAAASVKLIKSGDE